MFCVILNVFLAKMQIVAKFSYTSIIRSLKYTTTTVLQPLKKKNNSIIGGNFPFIQIKFVNFIRSILTEFH